MSESLRERLNQEVTRKQFLQYSAGALLMVFGLNNLITLLTGSKPDHKSFIPITDSADRGHGFGSSKFGV